MKIILSPAKTFDLSPPPNLKHQTVPLFQGRAVFLNSVLEEVGDYSAFYKCSSAVADEASRYIREFNSAEKKEALFSYGGLVFQNISPSTLTVDDITFLQGNLFILSGLYGILHPLDVIAPYRLEMSQKFSDRAPENLRRGLYNFWKGEITSVMKECMEEGEILLNLASSEYSKAVDRKRLNGKFITVDFMESKGDKLRSQGTYSKQARGKMIRYIAQNRINSLEKIIEFSEMGYEYLPGASSDENIVFVR